MQRVPSPLYLSLPESVRHMAPDSRTNSEADGTQHREELGKTRLKKQGCKGKKKKQAFSKFVNIHLGQRNNMGTDLYNIHEVS